MIFLNLIPFPSFVLFYYYFNIIKKIHKFLIIMSTLINIKCYSITFISLKEKNMKIATIMTAIALTVSVNAFAQTQAPVPARTPSPIVQADRAKVQSDRATVKAERDVVKADVTQLRADKAAGNTAAVATDRATVKADRATLRTDVQAVRADKRQLRSDRQANRAAK
jgi:lipopolysaccharide export system protein LptC